MIQSDQTMTFFENAFSPSTVRFEDAGVIVSSSSSEREGLFSLLLKPEIIRALMIPGAVFVVIIYQFYWKKPSSSAKKPNIPTSKEERDKEF